MHGSEAPVYVVVKSFAASMAACITTQAAKSFAYPNAVILHHQIQSFGGGNLTQQQEWVKEMEEWWRRLADPVAQKMGITREEFIKRMYAHSSSGDWNEFADNAQKLHWVDEIVEKIEETGTVRDPELAGVDAATRRFPTGPSHENNVSGMTEQKDEKGRPYMTLPSLNPFDCYWLYNPTGYYRMP
jgi:ATP-dependent Clp protease protease subunit